jgi:serine/threonine-protein kinase
MGEVYRARDRNLNRDVAVKVLPAALASDPQYMVRFEREAQVLASLNHPNIATVYGIEQCALVMELVEGADLRGPLALEEAIPIARQIAAGLEAAHERGIVHRDLKPANIKLTPTGVVKILDFGLAKPTGESQAAANATQSPTISLTMTQAGVILGTAAYMAPEQARGKPVDKRADIWAFGVVFYEMLTGKRLFEGEDLTETLASVVKDKPDLSLAPARVRPLLERCLEKDPKKRLRDIGDMELLLVERPAPVSSSVTRPIAKLPWITATALGVALGIALWAPWRSTKPSNSPLLRLDVDLGADVSLPAPAASGSDVAISPDGTRLAYVSGKPTRLFLRRLDQPKPAELPGTNEASYPFFSPDGQWVGFRAGTKLHKVSVEGGAVVPLVEIGLSNFAGASWGEDGSIVLSEAVGKGLMRIPAGGGPPETLAALGHGELALGLPQILPGGKAILIQVNSGFEPDKNNVEVLTLADRRRKVVVRGGASARYVGTPGGAGYLIYLNRATLFAIPFDPDKLETRGAAVAILDDVAYESLVGTGQFAFSPAPFGHGTLVERRNTGRSSEVMKLVWVDPLSNGGGKKEPLPIKPGLYSSISLSPDGKRIALSGTQGDKTDLWIYDLQRDVMTRLTFGGGAYDSPVWGPDGQNIAFTSMGTGIFLTRADGASQPRLLLAGKEVYPIAFTPDGKWLVYDLFEGGSSQIWTAPLEVEGGQLKAGKPEPVLNGGFSALAWGLSPDGRWLAYNSNESGRNELYVQAFAPSSSAPGGKWQISDGGGGAAAVWSGNGHELLYVAGGSIMAANYTVNGDMFVAEKSRVWIAKPGLRSPVWGPFGVTPDGKRVLLLTPAQSEEEIKPEHEVVFFLSFLDELRRRVPSGK